MDGAISFASIMGDSPETSALTSSPNPQLTCDFLKRRMIGKRRHHHHQSGVPILLHPPLAARRSPASSPELPCPLLTHGAGGALLSLREPTLPSVGIRVLLFPYDGWKQMTESE